MSLRLETLAKLKRARTPLSAYDLAKRLDVDERAVWDVMRKIMQSPGNKGGQVVSYEKESRLRYYSMSDDHRHLTPEDIAKLLPFKMKKKKKGKKIAAPIETTEVVQLKPDKTIDSISIEEVTPKSVTIEVDPKSVNTLRISGEGADTVDIKFV